MKPYTASAAICLAAVLSTLLTSQYRPVSTAQALFPTKKEIQNIGKVNNEAAQEPAKNAALPVPLPTENTVKTPSLKELLRNAIRPVGKTLYVWGGGWNEEDTGSGIETRSLGLSGRWEEFFKENDASYNFMDTQYQIHDGLDCSGFIGWTLYNTFNQKDGEEGLVVLSGQTGESLAARGWGETTPAYAVEDFQPGDLMYNDGHVYLVLGQYDDGSVLLVHSTPPGGVQISGTPAASGSADSEAVIKAGVLMEKYYPDFYNRYPPSAVDPSFIYGFNQFRWNVQTMPDAEIIQSRTPDQIVEFLYPE